MSNNTLYLLYRTNVRTMDVLSDILEKVKLSSVVYFKSDFSSPWGMDVAKGPFAQFHIVTKGQCILNAMNTKWQLFAGDIVVFPCGTSHWLADNEDANNRKNGENVMNAIAEGKSLFKGEYVSTTLVCGHFEFDRSMNHPFIHELPEIIHITDSERKETLWLENIANLLVQETNSGHSGSNIIANKLGEVLFIHALRAFMEKNLVKKGFLAAIRDERISRVLKTIHNSPENNWHLSTLAQIAGMSRTGFSNQFKALIGETPLTYVTNWRILQAKELLKESKKSVGEIAEAVGYQSEAAFNRVFKKYAEQTPLKYRQAVLAS